jgi:AraC-like DNA-binding protein/Flp pilus assembly protein TadD
MKKISILVFLLQIVTIRIYCLPGQVQWEEQNSTQFPLFLYSTDQEFFDHLSSMPIYNQDLYDYHIRELEEIYRFAAKNKNGKLMIAMAQIQLDLRNSRSEYSFLEFFFNQLLSEHQAFLSDEHLAELNLYLSSTYVQNKKYDLAEKSLEKVFALTHRESLLAPAYMLEGTLAKHKGNMDQALYHYYEALEYFKANSDTNMQITLLSDIGNTYKEINNLEQALIHFEQAEALAATITEYLSLGSFYNNLGIVYEKNQKEDKALAAYQKALEIALQLQNKKLQAIVLHSLGILHKNQSNFGEALSFYQKSLDICKEIGNHYGYMLNFANMGEALMHLGRLELSQSYLDSAIYLCNDLDLKFEKKEILSQLSALAVKKGNYKKAHDLSEERLTLHELLFNLQQDKRIEELKIKYETQIKDQEIFLQAARLAKEKERSFLLTLALIFLLLSLLGISYFLSYKNKKLKTIYSINLAMLQKREKLEKEILNPSSAQTNLVKEEVEDYVPEMDEQEIDKYRQLFLEIESLMSNQQMYKDPNLSIATLADVLNSNTTYVSRAINTFTENNFNSFVNELRVLAAQKEIKQKGKSANLNKIMEECGFSGRTTFYTAFQKHAGMTPAQFRKLVTQDSSEQEA